MSLSCEQSLTSTPLVVLDTNAVLDWLLFGDPGMAVLAEALTAGRVRWVATAPMRAEFDHVLRRGLGQVWSAGIERIAEQWQHLCRPAAAPIDPSSLRCADPDDQKFLDLAAAVGAHWLVTRDKALLRLARQASLRSLRIVPPARWQPQ